MSEYVVGIDLGGTRMRAALFDDELQLLDRREVPTNAKRGRDDTLERMLELVRGVLSTDKPVSGIGISAPGPSNPKTGVLVAPPNLPGWHNVPLVEILQQEFGYPAYLGNDANVAALAETAIGAARGYRHVIFVTISTGIGGGIICDGRLLLGRDGLAAEVGHMPLVIGAEERVTTLEKEAAGPALARKVRARIEQGEKSLVSEIVGGDLDKISGGVVGRAAEQGDALALSVVRRAGWVVGLGITSLLHVFNPEIIVFGGGVSTLGDLLFAPMREAIEQYCIDDAYWRDLRLKPAELGENVSLVGAGALVVTHGGGDDVAAFTRKLDEV
jgi:glucokinase